MNPELSLFHFMRVHLQQCLVRWYMSEGWLKHHRTRLPFPHSWAWCQVFPSQRKWDSSDQATCDAPVPTVGTGDGHPDWSADMQLYLLQTAMLWNLSIRTSINLASSSSVWFSSHMHQWDLTRDPLAGSHRSHTHTDRWRSGTPHKAAALAIFWPKHHKFAQVLTPIFPASNINFEDFFSLSLHNISHPLTIALMKR